MAEQLLWIKKTVESESLASDAVELSIIQKHVQSRKIERNKAKPLVHNGLGKLRWRLPNPVTPYVNEPDEDNQSAHRNTDQLMMLPQDPELTTLPTGASMEPFGAFALPINADLLQYLHYFERVWSATAFQSPLHDEETCVRMNTDVFERIRNSLTDEVHMYSLLAATASRMKTVNDNIVPPLNASEIFAAKALESLRLHIEKGRHINEHHILDVLFLAACEIYCSNLDGARAHLRGVRRLIENVGGIHLLDSYIQQLCRNIDFFVAAVCISPSVINLDWSIRDDRFLTAAPHNTVDQWPMHWPNNSLTGVTFFEHRDILEPTLLNVIAEAISCAKLAICYKIQASDSSLGASRKRLRASTGVIVDWTETLAYRLLHEVRADKHIGQNLSELVNEVCVIALLMWLSYMPVGMMSTLWEETDGASFLKLVPGRGSRLVEQLSDIKILENSSTSRSRLLLWVVGIGIVCAVDEDDTEWCARMFGELAHSLGMSSCEDVTAFIEGYLWVHNFDSTSYDVIADLLDSLAQSEAVRTVVEWTAVTRPSKAEKGERTRVSDRPSNWYRMGA